MSITEAMRDPIHPNIEQYSKEELCARAFKYLVSLLQKLSMTVAAKDLLLYVPTLLDIVDEDKELDAMNKRTAIHIIFMCETNTRILRILSTNPRHNAYYNHPRFARLEKRGMK